MLYTLIYFVEIARYLGWCQFFSALCTSSYPRGATLYLSSAFHPSLPLANLFKSDLIDGARALRRWKKLTIGCVLLKRKKGVGGDVEVWRWKDVIYITISADHAHTFISTHVCNSQRYHDRYLEINTFLKNSVCFAQSMILCSFVINNWLCVYCLYIYIYS